MQIDRTGEIRFGNAYLKIMEEGIPRDWDARKDWEKNFKRQVFARIVQQMNRLGWTCRVPEDMIEQYSADFARNHRACRKGDLHAFLDLSGRCIELKFWQSVNTPNRPDHGGRYEPDREAVMPYLLRLEMERTRRRIRTYLCNVFSGYEFVSELNDGRQCKRGPGHLTALEWVRATYKTSWHFKGDTSTYEISKCNSRDADGQTITHGSRVWGFNRFSGRPFTGIAYYNINNMWWVVTGKYDVQNQASFDLHTQQPENLRRKRNDGRRRKRLEQELAKAIQSMNFTRAEVLRKILWPPGTALFMVWSKKNSAYHRAGFSGYANDTINAGKFTADEVAGWDNDRNEIVPMEARA